MNGELQLIGTGRTEPGRTLGTPGNLRFNKKDWDDDAIHVFGGQLYNLNIWQLHLPFLQFLGLVYEFFWVFLTYR